jgi:hypothetical protein
MSRDSLELRALANVRFLGVKHYEDAQRLIQHFDVAIIPHNDNEMTKSMNPLKAFVYSAAGIAVVSTSVANLPDFPGLIRQANGCDEFLLAIENALQRGREPLESRLFREHSWDVRLATVLDLIHAKLGRRRRFNVLT